MDKDALLARTLQEKLDQEEQDVQLALKLQMEENGEFSDDEDDIPEGVTTCNSHLFPKIVLWSSHPEIVKPDYSFHLEDEDSFSTLFVHSPTQSEECSITAITNHSLICRLIRPKISSTDPKGLRVQVFPLSLEGMGVDSGLPDYRSAEGLWKAYPPLQAAGLTLPRLTHPDWFSQDPSSAWGFYGHRAKLYRNAKPHEIVDQKAGNYFIMTSNIDNQFEKATFAPNKIYNCHGNLQWVQCAQSPPCLSSSWELSSQALEGLDEVIPSFVCLVQKSFQLPSPPLCPGCDGPSRPNVSMAGDLDTSWEPSRSHEQKRLLLEWLNALPSSSSEDIPSLVVIEVGCGTSLHSIRFESDILLEQKHNQNIYLIRINPHDASVPSGKHVGIPLGALAALKAIETSLGSTEEMSRKRNQSEELLSAKKVKREKDVNKS